VTTAADVAGFAASDWQELALDGCVCSDGSELTMFERVADPTKVVLYFEGGGACFSVETCDPNGSPTYTISQQLAVSDFDRRRGAFDFDNPENPLADFSWVYVPYCTGDVHIGNTTHDYGNGVVIEHRGHANATKALEYLATTYPGAAKLVVTGESAGSVPTPQFAASAADLLPEADIVTFGDSSGAYPDVDGISALIGAVWGTTEAMPDWPEAAGLQPQDWSFPEQYAVAGAHAPRVRFGRFDFAFDEVQTFFGSLAGVGAHDLVTLIDRNEDEIEATGVEVATFVAPGARHTISSDDDLYRLEVGGVRLIDWLTDLIEGPDAPPDVHCETCE
jgi:hypothetical protein